MTEIDPHGIPQHEPGAKMDANKPMVGLMFNLFPRALLAVAEVVTYGAHKYTPGGCLKVPDALARYQDAEGRHLLQGYIEERDKESTLRHLAHKAWNALIILELELRNGKSSPGEESK